MLLAGQIRYCQFSGHRYLQVALRSDVEEWPRIDYFGLMRSKQINEPVRRQDQPKKYTFSLEQALQEADAVRERVSGFTQVEREQLRAKYGGVLGIRRET